MRFLFALLLSLIPTGCASDSAEIICHRGLPASAPENTLPAIEAAFEAGCDVVEIDVRITRDGHAVLMHDSDLSRTTGGRGRVEELNYDELRRLDAGSKYSEEFKDVQIPTLHEAISVAQGHGKLYLDLKTRQIKTVTEVVRQVSFSSSTYYRAYSPAEARRLCRMDPEAAVVVDLGGLLGLRDLLEDLAEECPNLILSSGIDRWKDEAGTVAFVRSRGVPIFVQLLGNHATREKLKEALALRPRGVLLDANELLLRSAE